MLSKSTIWSLTHLSLSITHTLSLSHSHTLPSRPSVLGEHMWCSDPTLILLPLLSIIQSALLRKKKNGRKRWDKQITPVFLTTAYWKFSFPFYLILSKVRLSAVQSYCVLAKNLWVNVSLFIEYTQIRHKQNHWLELLLPCMPLQRFLECNHFKIQAAQLPPEEHEYFTLCKWGAHYEFLDGSDYDTVISALAMWWWLSLLCHHQRLSITAYKELINTIRKEPEVLF